MNLSLVVRDLANLQYLVVVTYRMNNNHANIHIVSEVTQLVCAYTIRSDVQFVHVKLLRLKLNLLFFPEFRTTAKAEFAKQKTYYHSKHESNNNIGFMFDRNGCSTGRNVETVVSKQCKQFLTILMLLLFCVRFDDVTVRWHDTHDDWTQAV